MKYKTVDKLAEINARIAELSIEAEKLKDKLKERGEGVYEGSTHEAIVNEFERSSLDISTVKKYLTVRQLKRALKTTKVVSVTVRPIDEA